MLKEYADLHCDTLWRCYDRKCGLDAPGLQIRQNVPFRHLQTYAIYIPDSAPDPYAYFNAVYDYGKQLFEQRPEMIPCRRAREIEEAFSSGKKPYLISVEGGGFFTDHPAENVRRVSALVEKGVVFLSICYNAGNRFAGGINCPERGLSAQGTAVLQLLHDAKIGVDVSHLNERSTDDVLSLFSEGVVATHSCCKGIVPHPRNLTDAQIRAIARGGGLIGINFYPPFLSKNPAARQSDVLRQIRYLEKLGAGESICFGGDFDGIDATPADLRGLADIPSLAWKIRLCHRCAEKYLYRNVLRFLK